MDHLSAHLDQPFDLPRLASSCHLSVSRLCHLFKTETGLTLQRYSEDLRLREAQRLLTHTRLAIGDVAQATGFADPYYFSKRFRRFAGVAPSRWRQR
jgi:AraC family transcriptional regulator of arabinose operon